MAGLGYTLYHALRLQLEVRDRAEILGKVEVVQYLLREVDSPAGLEQRLQRFREILVGHPHLSIGVRTGEAWIVRPREDIVLASERLAYQAGNSGSGIATVSAGDAMWWLRHIRYQWSGTANQAAPIDVVVAVDVSESQHILSGHAGVASLVVVVGTLLSGVLAYFVARSGLAPIAEVAARAQHVTAHRLSVALSAEDAPTEIRGLATSINRMLERLNDSFRALEQFSADIAHELRTPLSNLLLQTQVILGRPRPAEEYREALLSNLEELQRLHRMVSEMLFLARADYGMLGLAVMLVDLAQEAADVAEYFEPAASARLQIIAVDGQAVVSADRSMVRRVITNLLSNAVRYSPHGTRILVHIESGADTAIVEVTNPCKPIASEDLPRLFDRFSRRGDRCEDGNDGAGLGLAIVGSIMRLHGGAVSAQSGDFGVRFTLHFPTAENFSMPKHSVGAMASVINAPQSMDRVSLL